MADTESRKWAVKQQTKTILDNLLQRDKSGKGWMCPVCESGSGRHGTGLVVSPRNYIKCFSCGLYGDVIDIVGVRYGLSGYIEKLEATERIAGCLPTLERVPTHAPRLQASKKDYTKFFMEAHSRVSETDYFERRGLSDGIVERFSLGYARLWERKEDGTPTQWNAAVIPTGAGSYTARNTDPAATHSERYRKRGPTSIFNAAALAEEGSCWVCEGEINAMSLIELGAAAVALGSATDWRKLLAEIDTRRPVGPLIISLDDDTAGRLATEELATVLTERGIGFHIADVCRPGKDLNDELLADRDGLKTKIRTAERAAKRRKI